MVLTSSAEEITPTATVGMPTPLRIASAKGVWYERPKAGVSSGVTWPVETSMAAAPATSKARAMARTSSGLVPPSTQSVAEMRTVSGLCGARAARIARKTSSGKRSRPSTSPP
jgi:hypothetical protein